MNKPHHPYTNLVLILPPPKKGNPPAPSRSLLEIFWKGRKGSKSASMVGLVGRWWTGNITYITSVPGLRSAYLVHGIMFEESGGNLEIHDRTLSGSNFPTLKFPLLVCMAWDLACLPVCVQHFSSYDQGMRRLMTMPFLRCEWAQE